ncbi:MAG: sigma-70 family RNA polymerase sigma factor [Candidatus Solibacter sp.]
MSDHGPSEATALLLEWRDGDRDAANRLFPLVYRELRAIARARLALERPGHTLEATALVHEAYLRIIGQEAVNWECRAQFFGFAANVIRNILVDHARLRGRQKRGGGQALVSLEDVLAAPEEHSVELLDLHEALELLARRDERQGKIVEMRFFGGLSIEETAHVLDLSPTTVKSEWRMARAWLYRQLGHPAKEAE